jgi:hypothetical protein
MHLLVFHSPYEPPHYAVVLHLGSDVQMFPSAPYTWTPCALPVSFTHKMATSVSSDFYTVNHLELNSYPKDDA